MIIEEYSNKFYNSWNNFVENSRQGTFLLKRDFMEYHSDRYNDNSLIFLDDDKKIVALLPANLKNDLLISHEGLSYGGLIYGNKQKTCDILKCFEVLIAYLKHKNIKKFIYKRIPQIYHKIPSDEDLYSLFSINATLYRRDIGYVIDNENIIKISRNKKTRYRKNFNDDYEIKITSDYNLFYEIGTEALARFNVKPVHNSLEIEKLISTFKNNIKLYGVYFKNEMHAVCLVFETSKVLHVQSMYANKFAKKNNFIDFMYLWLIDNFSKKFKYISFGISTENNGKTLNEGLAKQKESFGSRAICYDFYELNL